MWIADGAAACAARESTSLSSSENSNSSTILFGREFVLFVAGESAGDWPADDVEIVAIPKPSFADDYGLHPGGAALVRPDGVVGWRSPEANPSGLRDALDRILAGG